MIKNRPDNVSLVRVALAVAVRSDDHVVGGPVFDGFDAAPVENCEREQIHEIRSVRKDVEQIPGDLNVGRFQVEGYSHGHADVEFGRIALVVAIGAEDEAGSAGAAIAYERRDGSAAAGHRDTTGIQAKPATADARMGRVVDQSPHAAGTTAVAPAQAGATHHVNARCTGWRLCGYAIRHTLRK